MNKILKPFLFILLILSIIFLVYGLFNSKESISMKFSFPMNNQVNVYGEKLMPCEPTQPNKGSQLNGTCSELGGGVHQICFKVNEKTKSFSKDTEQGFWSEGREGKNHCMCLGAWALYKAKQNIDEIERTSDELKCESIPSIAFSEDYVSKWNTWNGNELPAQVKNGVVALYNQCKTQTNGDTKKLEALNSYYNKLKKSSLYNKAIKG
jgi:uncharacterized protein (DUF2237 family)